MTIDSPSLQAPSAQSLRAARAALSELFLDIEINDDVLGRLARALAKTGLGEAELERIFIEELEPVLSANMRVAVGVWQGFDLDWLEDQIRQRAQRQQAGGLRSLLDRAMRAVQGRSAARADWDKLKAMLATTGG